MIIGVGVDIVKVARFHTPQATRFMQRVFSVREQEYIASKGEKGRAQTMAGLFAAKEAVAKTLGTGFGGFSPCDIEILRTKNGKPYVKLHSLAVRAFKKSVDAKISSTENGKRYFSVQVSISHTATDAIAFAVLL